MSTAIVLSSSPPRIFARSPTSIESSPNLPLPSHLFQASSPGHKRFKTTNSTRDGLDPGCSNRRSLLQPKYGAENALLKTPTKDRFKAVTVEDKRHSRFVSQEQTEHSKCVSTHNDVGCEVPARSTGDKEEDTAKRNKRSPQLGSDYTSLDGRTVPRSERAVPRRTDWTPPKDDTDASADLNQQTASPRALSKDVLLSFAFDGGMDQIINPKSAVKVVGVKRRRVELIQKPTSAVTGHQIPVGDSESAVTSKTLPRRKKPAAKKAMTITNLATSLYFGQNNGEHKSPAVQYPTANQAGPGEDCAGRRSSMKQLNASSRKASAKKKETPKPKLLSPLSALRSLDTQQAVFGSASQLARDELPSRQELSSDPVSPQMTQPISVPSSLPSAPRGTSKFVKKRNLWGAADRDEDNALLHIDTIDLLDSADARSAFAGKDTLLEPVQTRKGSSSLKLGQQSSNVQRVRNWSLAPLSSRPTNHPNDLSPPLNGSGNLPRCTDQMRAVHTAPATNQQAEAHIDYQLDASERLPFLQDVEKPVGEDLASDVLPKPNYGEMAVEELQSHLTKHGLKMYKRRFKMVEVLEQFWEDTYNPKSSPMAAVQSHNDFLSKVHDISGRPQPRVKKPKRKAESSKSKKPSARPAKPSRRKPTQTKDGPTRPKATGRKTTTTAHSEEAVVDVDDLLDTSALEVASEQTGLAPPVRSPTLLAPDSRHTIVDGCTSNVRNSPTLERREAEASSKDGSARVSQDIGLKIRAAIMMESEEAANSGRDHVKDPTWHEKILQYDPIILEDLATWLNTKGLRKVHEDNEVSAVEVRTWCESNGICCLWRGGWRGRREKLAED